MAEIWGNLSMAEELRSPFAPVGLGEVEEEVAALELGHELMPPPGGIGQLSYETPEQGAVRQAIAAGTTDLNELTNRVFFARHPERGGRALSSSEPNFAALSSEWKTIRDTVVRPLLGTTPSSDLWVPGAERVARLRGRDARPAAGEVVLAGFEQHALLAHRVAHDEVGGLVPAGHSDAARKLGHRI